MDRLHDFGKRHGTRPIAHVDEVTRYIEAGSVVFGIEPRQLNSMVLTAHKTKNAEEYENLEAEIARVADLDFDLSGVSIHVFDAAERNEYLRFDAFPEDPHYHYVTPNSGHTLVAFDDVAEPDFVGWVLERLATQLAPMLEHAGGGALVATLDKATIDAALVQVRAIVDELAAQ